MNHKLYALTMLEEYGKFLLDNTDLDNEVLQVAIKQLKDLEHYSHYTSGLWATDRPDLFQAQIKNELMYPLNFWGPVDSCHILYAPTFVPYVDETVNPSESYLVFCNDGSPWTQPDSNMIRVYSNAESHKLLKILETNFGIPNNHKG